MFGQTAALLSVTLLACDLVIILLIAPITVKFLTGLCSATSSASFFSFSVVGGALAKLVWEVLWVTRRLHRAQIAPVIVLEIPCSYNCFHNSRAVSYLIRSAPLHMFDHDLSFLLHSGMWQCLHRKFVWLYVIFLDLSKYFLHM
jgi:hypothetical protein